ncbi:MAG: YihY/virulence factor BrkB family protein [Myxococcales bacterium]
MASTRASDHVWPGQFASGPRDQRPFVERALSLLLLAGKGFLRDEGFYRASALAFDTMLGLVPLLAFLVSTLKGFGAYQALMRDTIRPGIVRTMIAMGAEQDTEAVGLLGVFLKVLDIVEQASFGTLGVVGLVFLLYIVVLLLVSVEDAMNHIFGVEKARSVTRKITDYSAILFVTPLTTILAAGVAAGTDRFAWLKQGFFSQVFAALLMVLCLSVFYLGLPYGHVRLRSAALGGLVAGVGWYLVIVVYVHFQVGVARYSALYSTFAAIPLFLVWVFTSWIVVLLGAEVAAVHDKPELYQWRIRGGDIDHRSRLFIAVLALSEMARRSQLGLPPLGLSALADRTDLPSELLRAELELFVAADFLMRNVEHGEPRYAIARDLDSINVGVMTDVLEKSCSKNAPTEARQKAWEFVDERLLSRDATIRAMTLRQLSELIQVESTDRADPVA